MKFDQAWEKTSLSYHFRKRLFTSRAASPAMDSHLALGRQNFESTIYAFPHAENARFDAREVLIKYLVYMSNREKLSNNVSVCKASA